MTRASRYLIPSDCLIEGVGIFRVVKNPYNFLGHSHILLFDPSSIAISGTDSSQVNGETLDDSKIMMTDRTPVVVDRAAFSLPETLVNTEVTRSSFCFGQGSANTFSWYNNPAGCKRTSGLFTGCDERIPYGFQGSAYQIRTSSYSGQYVHSDRISYMTDVPQHYTYTKSYPGLRDPNLGSFPLYVGLLSYGSAKFQLKRGRSVDPYSIKALFEAFLHDNFIKPGVIKFTSTSASQSGITFRTQWSFDDRDRPVLHFAYPEGTCSVPFVSGRQCFFTIDGSGFPSDLYITVVDKVTDDAIHCSFKVQKNLSGLMKTPLREGDVVALGTSSRLAVGTGESIKGSPYRTNFTILPSSLYASYFRDLVLKEPASTVDEGGADNREEEAAFPSLVSPAENVYYPILTPSSKVDYRLTTIGLGLVILLVLYFHRRNNVSEESI